jgi:hypothetical protein
LLLVLPLIAMQFTDEVDWDETDFIVMGALLFSACGAFELAVRITGNTAYRAGVGVAAVSALLLIWINLAVSIIGSEDNPANLMYLGVLAVGIAGAFSTDFKPDGMARALLATALAQALVAVITLIFGWGSEGENWPKVIVVLNGFFSALWLGSAWLFSQSSAGAGFRGHSTVGRLSTSAPASGTGLVCPASYWGERTLDDGLECHECCRARQLGWPARGQTAARGGGD